MTRRRFDWNKQSDERKTKEGLDKQRTQAHRQMEQAGKHDLLSIVDIDLGLGLPVDTIDGGKGPFGHTDCH